MAYYIRFYSYHYRLLTYCCFPIHTIIYYYALLYVECHKPGEVTCYRRGVGQTGTVLTGIQCIISVL